MISQVIIGYRAWAITRRSKELGLFLLGLGLIVTALEWSSNVEGRIPVQSEVSVPRNAPLAISLTVFISRESKAFFYPRHQAARRKLS